MSIINTEILAIDNKARNTLITVNDKEINTPTFMPVATRGVIKSTPHTYLNKTYQNKTKIFLNLLHVKVPCLSILWLLVFLPF